MGAWMIVLKLCSFTWHKTKESTVHIGNFSVRVYVTPWSIEQTQTTHKHVAYIELTMCCRFSRALSTEFSTRCSALRSWDETTVFCWCCGRFKRWYHLDRDMADPPVVTERTVFRCGGAWNGWCRDGWPGTGLNLTVERWPQIDHRYLGVAVDRRHGRVKLLVRQACNVKTIMKRYNVFQFQL